MPHQSPFSRIPFAHRAFVLLASQILWRKLEYLVSPEDKNGLALNRTVLALVNDSSTFLKASKSAHSLLTGFATTQLAILCHLDTRIWSSRSCRNHHFNRLSVEYSLPPFIPVNLLAISKLPAFIKPLTGRPLA